MMMIITLLMVYFFSITFVTLTFYQTLHNYDLALDLSGMHAYRFGSTVFIPENHKNQRRILEIQIASQKFRILSFMQK